jgi:hypothetical protein
VTDKEVVREIELSACIERVEDGWLVRKHPEGLILGGGKSGAAAWHAARMTLFGENIRAILSEIPVSEKQ